MKNKLSKKLLSLFIAAVMIMTLIPLGVIAPLGTMAAEYTTTLYASELKNNTHLELKEDTLLIMDKVLYLKTVTGADYSFKVTGEETLNLASSETVVKVKNFICESRVLISSTSTTCESFAVWVTEYFSASGPVLVLYGNACLKAKGVYIASDTVNIRSNKYEAINSETTLEIDCKTLEINSKGSGLISAEGTTINVSNGGVINCEKNGITTTGRFSFQNAHVKLSGKLTINSGQCGITTENGSVRTTGPGYPMDIPELEKLRITAPEPIKNEGVVDLYCPDVEITATKENAPAIKANSVYVGGVFNVKTNGGNGLFAEYATLKLFSGVYKVSGAKGNNAALKAGQNLKIDENLSIYVPENATYDDTTVYDSSGNPAKEVHIYSLVDVPDITMLKPVEGAKPSVYESALIGLPKTYKFSHINWYEDGVLMKSTDVYKKGKSYKAEVALYTADYKIFENGVLGKINGKKVTTGLGLNNRMIYLYPDFGACLEVIKEASFTATAPVEGKTPSTYLTDSSSAYSVSSSSVRWYSSSDGGLTYKGMSSSTKFVGGNYYRMQFTITAANGYAFNHKTKNDMVTITVNGKPATAVIISFDNQTQIDAYVEFGKCNDYIIEEIEIQVEAPKSGEHPSYDANAFGTGYCIDKNHNSYYDAYWVNEKWYYVKNGVQWWDITTGSQEYVYEKDVFLPGHTYRCVIYLETESGYKFAYDMYTTPETWPTAKVNGKTAEINKGWTNAFETRVMANFDCMTQIVSKVDALDVDVPLAGGKPDYDVDTSAPHLYSVTSVKWYNALGEAISSDTTFEAGMVYRVFIKLMPNALEEGAAACSFSSTSEVTINGKSLELQKYSNADSGDIENYFNNAYYENSQAIYIGYTFKPAPRPDKGDVNVDGDVDILDLVFLKNLILGLESNRSNADVNGDGKVNAADLTALRKLLFENVV